MLEVIPSAARANVILLHPFPQPLARMSAVRPTYLFETQATVDRIGLWGAAICALHCALLPLLLALLPSLGLRFIASADFDQTFTVFAAVLGVIALALGSRRHRAWAPWLALLPGLALLFAGSFSPVHSHDVGHFLLMVAGGALIAAAHYLNLRLGQRRYA